MVSVARQATVRSLSQDIRRVLEAAQSAALPSDREVLHTIPQEFFVDEQGGIADPLGMLGSRLEVSTCILTSGNHHPHQDAADLRQPRGDRGASKRSSNR